MPDGSDPNHESPAYGENARDHCRRHADNSVAQTRMHSDVHESTGITIGAVTTQTSTPPRFTGSSSLATGGTNT